MSRPAVLYNHLGKGCNHGNLRDNQEVSPEFSILNSCQGFSFFRAKTNNSSICLTNNAYQLSRDLPHVSVWLTRPLAVLWLNGSRVKTNENIIFVLSFWSASFATPLTPTVLVKPKNLTFTIDIRPKPKLLKLDHCFCWDDVCRKSCLDMVSLTGRNIDPCKKGKGCSITCKRHALRLCLRCPRRRAVANLSSYWRWMGFWPTCALVKIWSLNPRSLVTWSRVTPIHFAYYCPLASIHAYHTYHAYDACVVWAAADHAWLPAAVFDHH